MSSKIPDPEFIFRVTIFREERPTDIWITKEFTNDVLAVEFFDANIQNLNGVEKELWDLFSKSVITKLGNLIKFEKIQKLGKQP